MASPKRHAKHPLAGAQSRRPVGSDWTPEDAPRLAREAGLQSLGDHHWRVITSCREEAARTGHVPGLTRLALLTGFDEPALKRLFPGDVEVIVARVAGLRLHRKGGAVGGGRETQEESP